MLLKEIFSKKKKLFREILSQKLLNQTTYEKSYIRRASLESTSVCLLDNSRSFFNTIKRVLRRKRKGRIKNFRKFKLKSKKKKSKKKTKKSKRLLRIKKRRSKKKKSRNLTKKLKNPYKRRDAQIKRIGRKGSSSYTTTFLYRNRKINLIRFKQPICSIVRSMNFIDLFLKGLKTLITGKIKKNDSTLIILEAKRGGFSCYSSGFRGFLPRNEFRRIVKVWAKGIAILTKKSGDFAVLKQFIKSQRFQWSISPPPRFKFFIRTLVQNFRFRRNKFILSRKKKTETPTKMLPKFIFISKKYLTSEADKLLAQQRKLIPKPIEIPFDKYRWAKDGWESAFKNYFKRCKYKKKN